VKTEEGNTGFTGLLRLTTYRWKNDGKKRRKGEKLVFKVGFREQGR